MSMVEELAGASPPLLMLEASSSADGPAWSSTVSTTATGRQLLDRTLDRVAVCGIDRWLGGVHLQGRVAPWRWDPGKGRIVRV
jgi:hypothetical protein